MSLFFRTRSGVLFLAVLLSHFFAQSSARADFTPRFSEVVRGGVATAGVGLSSSRTEEAQGSLALSLPRGATIRAAWLFSSVYNFNGGSVGRVRGNRRFVRVGENVVVTRYLEGNGDRTAVEMSTQFRRHPTYHLFVTDIVDTVRDRLTAATAGAPTNIAIPIVERGDDAEAANIWISGHAIVVVYELAGAPPRVVLIAEGPLPVPEQSGGAFSQTFDLPAGIGARCSPGVVGYDPIVLSVGVALDLADCDDTTSLRIGTTTVATRLGGPDDNQPGATGTCFETGGAAPNGLFTIGNLGVDARGMPRGTSGDQIQGVSGRTEDELLDLSSAVTRGARQLQVGLSKLVQRSGDVTDIPLLILQAPVDSRDTDGDGITDEAEGMCGLTDSDRDGAPDFVDLDSDNDCALDQNERSGSNRTSAAANPNTNCADTDSCTTDRCAAGVCAHDPAPAGTRCADGVCDGNTPSVCVGCLADDHCGGARRFCDVPNQTCIACRTAQDCNDQNSCTTDVCRAGSCVANGLSRGTRCPEGFCDGDTSAPMCVSCLTDAQCPRSAPRCDTATHSCGQCNADSQCNDRNACTEDSCSGGSCVFAPLSAGSACSGGVCDGAATAPRCVVCLSDAQCSGGRSHCQANQCVECRGNSDCDDGNACTEESCSAGTCRRNSTPRGRVCASGVCNGQDQCVECVSPAQCDDGNACTTDRCTDSTCSQVPARRGQPCEGGVCNGSADGPMCVACMSDRECGGSTPHCEVTSHVCQACTTDAHCGDGNSCTTDSCRGGQCVNAAAPVGATCPNGVCDGSQPPMCVACVSDAQCSGARSHCNVTAHRCDACLTAAHCDDGNPCTADACSNGGCTHTPIARGQTCSQDGGAGGVCDGGGDCVQCISAAMCNDGNSCTSDRCTDGQCQSRAIARGRACEGAEGVCTGGEQSMCGQCTADSHCGGATPRCEQTSHQCVACVTAAHCDDRNACTTDQCDAGSCRHTEVASGTSCGRGVCDVAAEPPMCVACLSDAQCSGRRSHCDVAAHQCVQCLSAGDCNDGNACTEDACNAGVCSHASTPRGQTCPEGICSGAGQCRQCLTAAQCDDQDACTQDMCRQGSCAHRRTPGAEGCTAT